MSEVGYDVWGAVNGAVSIVAVFIALTTWILSWRPSAMVHLLHHYLKQTEGEFNTAVSDGLLCGGSGVWLRFRFWALQIQADDIRSQVYDIHTWGEELSSWWKGTSSTMSIICNDLTKLRAALAKRNSRERREIASSSYPYRLAHWLGLRDRLFMTSPESAVSSTPFEKSDLPLPHTPTILAGTSLMLGLAPILPTAGIPGVHGGAETHNHPCLGPKASAHAAILPPATPVPRCPEKGTKIGDDPHHLVSDKDLKALLSYVAIRPPQGGWDGGKRKRASRKELLLRYGRQLFGPDAPASGWFPEPFPTAVPTKRRAARSRFGAIRRLMRSTLSRMCTQSAADVATVDLESSRPQHAEVDDCDEEDDWCDA